jgi:hypothetical protein
MAGIPNRDQDETKTSEAAIVAAPMLGATPTDCRVRLSRGRKVAKVLK